LQGAHEWSVFITKIRYPMKTVFQKCHVKCVLVILYIAILSVHTVQAQTCPQPVTSTITSYPNTYYPGQQATVNAGSTAVAIGAATSGTPISAGDVLLIIQMQGAQINVTNNITYGDGASGSGYRRKYGICNSNQFRSVDRRYINAADGNGE
jgi:hypothetical protein